eukprot:g63657.t1
MSVNCTLDQADWSLFPYLYYYPNGSLVLQGVPTYVEGKQAPVCVFPTRRCETAACCENSPALNQQTSRLWLYTFLAFILPYVLLKIWQHKRAQKAKQEALEREAKGLSSNPTGERTSLADRWNLKDKSPFVMYVYMAVFASTIAALVAEMSIMPNQVQTALSPEDRSAQLAMASFLEPIKQVFAFLEDSMTVRVGYALASSRYHELNQLLHISVIGGAICAIVAFIIMVILAMDDTTAKALLNPSGGNHESIYDAGCNLMPSSVVLLSHARSYWLIISASWLPQFTIRGLLGFFIGTGQILGYLIPMIIGAVVPLAIWFGLKPKGVSSLHAPVVEASGDSSIPTLTVLGISYGTADWITALCFFLFFLLSRAEREKYQLRCLFCTTDGSDKTVGLQAKQKQDPEGSRKGFLQLLKEVASEGLDLMCVDLAVQLSLTITIYIAAVHSFEIAYQLSALQAAYWSFGPSYMVGMMLTMKVAAASYIATGEYTKFRIALFIFAGFTICLMVQAIVVSVLFQAPIAFEYGQSACVYASTTNCAFTFASIFFPPEGLAEVFRVFGPVVGLQMLFQLLRTALAACHDFRFMAKASILTFVVVYVPAILIASLKYAEYGTAYYLAMYLPHFALIIVFGWRLALHVRTMKHKGEGPWTAHSMQEPPAQPSPTATDFERKPAPVSAPS